MKMNLNVLLISVVASFSGIMTNDYFYGYEATLDKKGNACEKWITGDSQFKFRRQEPIIIKNNNHWEVICEFPKEPK